LVNDDFCFEVVLVDISTDGILGLDFLKRNKCLVDISSVKMYVEGTVPELQLEGHLGFFRVSLKETISIPPQSEIICPGQLLAPADVIFQGSLVIEGVKSFRKAAWLCLQVFFYRTWRNVIVRLLCLTTNPQPDS
jgi:hypothetical protein